jgi:hypothetical protein
MALRVNDTRGNANAKVSMSREIDSIAFDGRGCELRRIGNYGGEGDISQE